MRERRKREGKRRNATGRPVSDGCSISSGSSAKFVPDIPQNHQDWQVEDEECTETPTATVVLDTCQRNNNNNNNNHGNGANNNNNNNGKLIPPMYPLHTWPSYRQEVRLLVLVCRRHIFTMFCRINSSVWWKFLLCRYAIQAFRYVNASNDVPRYTSSNRAMLF